MLNFQSLGSTGVPYSVIIAPNIEKLSRLPNHSSPNGQLLKITGKGFSKVPSQNTVMVVDQICEVKESDFYHITCEMPPFTAFNQAAYIGTRGMKRYFWNNTYTDLSSLDGIVTPTSVENFFEPEGPENLGFKYRDIWKGLFKAPKTGEYRFFISGDDYSYFLIDSVTPFTTTNAVYNPVEVAKVDGWSSYRDFTKYDDQISDNISLTADEYYYIEVKHMENWGGDHVTAGVEIPNDEDFWPVNHVYSI